MIISIRLGYIFFVCSQLICIFFVSFCSEVSGDREVQRTMLELLNQLDGFSSDERIKVSIEPST
jgi:hypothetical protein